MVQPVLPDIRPIATVGEIERCAQMMTASEPWITLGRGLEESRRLLADPSRERYVATIEGALAGFLILEMQGTFVGYLKTVCVAPECRNRGVGSALIRFAEDRVFRDQPNVFMLVSSFNRGAQRLYARLGYQVVGDLRDFVVAGHSEILVRKTVGPLCGFTVGRRTAGS
jgi:ribosomal protein S18 acetylase RimI-like enzyme